MIKCPHCGQQMESDNVFETEYHENGWTITRVQWYRCECGMGFTTISTFESDGDEVIDDPCI